MAMRGRSRCESVCLHCLAGEICGKEMGCCARRGVGVIRLAHVPAADVLVNTPPFGVIKSRDEVTPKELRRNHVTIHVGAAESVNQARCLEVEAPRRCVVLR